MNDAYYYNNYFYILGALQDATFNDQGFAPFVMKTTTNGEVEHLKLLNCTDSIEIEYFRCTGMSSQKLY